MMGFLPSKLPTAHHPTLCVLSDPPGAELDEDGSLVCPHGAVGEGEGMWRDKRHSIACELLMEVLGDFEHEGWP